MVFLPLLFLVRKLEEAPNPPSGLLFGLDITHLKFAGDTFPEGPLMPKFDDPFLYYYEQQGSRYCANERELAKHLVLHFPFCALLRGSLQFSI